MGCKGKGKLNDQYEYDLGNVINQCDVVCMIWECNFRRLSRDLTPIKPLITN